MAAKFVLQRSKNGKYFFVMEASNGQVILTSEMYEAKSNALDGITSVKVNAGIAQQYVRLVSRGNAAYFNLKARNGEIIGTSEMYSSPAARDAGAASVMRYAAEADIADRTSNPV